MKALIISDVHSNILALETVWKKEGGDAIYCAGDLADWGLHPKETLDWLRGHGAKCVRGNHDDALIACWRGGGLDRIPPEESDWIHYSARMLDENDIRYLEGLPETLEFSVDGFEYGMTHAYSGYDVIGSPEAFDAFAKSKFRNNPTRLVFGHRHRQDGWWLTENRTWVNPGSLSYRREDDPGQGAQYMVFQDGRMDFKCEKYDMRPIYDEIGRKTLRPYAKSLALWFYGPR